MSITTKIELTPPFPVGTKKWALMHGKAQEITVAAWMPDVQQPELGQMHVDIEWNPMYDISTVTDEKPVYRYILASALYDTAEELKSAIFDA